MLWLSMIAFAVALSFDGFAVGVSYGVRRISIPVLSLLVISLTSATAMGVSMLMGHLVSSLLSVELAEKVGAVILIGVGCWVLVQTWIQRKEKGEVTGERVGPGETGELEAASPEEYPVLKIRIRTLGLVIQILKEPHKADWDRSGTISIQEAILLGIALAMDALGAGFGAAMAGFKPLMTPVVVGVVKFILVSSGEYLGRNYAAKWLNGRAALLPGGVLVVLGLIQIVGF